MGKSAVNSPIFFYSDKTKFVRQLPKVWLYLDNSFLAFVTDPPLSRELRWFPFKGMRRQKWGNERSHSLIHLIHFSLEFLSDLLSDFYLVILTVNALIWTGF